jgi:hypothetical protein
VIWTLSITVVIEGVICLLYAVPRRKPVRPILLTSVFANLLTQSILWGVLNHFYQHYLTTLMITEFCIWLIEGCLLFRLRFNELKPGEAFFLSLLMNLSSFGIGWFLPI